MTLAPVRATGTGAGYQTGDRGKAMGQPKVSSICPAQRGAMPGERIVEVSSDAGGCLIALRVLDGVLIVEPYRQDDTVTVRVPDVRQQDWIASPKVTGVPVDYRGVTGVVEVTFTNGSEVFIHTDAHVNDEKPSIAYRGTEFLVSLHAVRNADGTWREWTDEKGFRREWAVRRRGFTNREAPRTYRAAVVAALLSLVQRLWNEETGRLAEYADAAQRLHGAHSDYVKTREALYTVQDQMNAARARMKKARP